MTWEALPDVRYQSVHEGEISVSNAQSPLTDLRELDEPFIYIAHCDIPEIVLEACNEYGCSNSGAAPWPNEYQAEVGGILCESEYLGIPETLYGQ